MKAELQIAIVRENDRSVRAVEGGMLTDEVRRKLGVPPVGWRKFLAVILLVLAGWCAGRAAGETEAVALTTNKNILFISSCNASQRWTNDVMAGFREYFHHLNLPVVINVQELDVMGNPSLQPRERELALLREQLAIGGYDLVVTLDNPAADLFFDDVLEVPSGTPWLFLGYDCPNVNRRSQRPGVTGLSMPLSALSTLEIALQLLPATEKVAFVLDGRANGFSMMRCILEECDRVPGVELLPICGREYSTEEMLAEIAGLPKNSLVIFHSWASVKEPVQIRQKQIVEKIRQIYAGPIFSTLDNGLDDGAIGGVITVGRQHGREGGAVAERILNGEAPEAIAFRRGGDRAIFDYRRLLAAGLSPALLPAGAELRNRPVSFWQQYRDELFYGGWGVLLAFGGVAAGLFFYFWHLKRLNIIFKAMPAHAVVADAAGRIHFFQADLPAGSGEIRFFTDLPEDVQRTFEEPIRAVLADGRPMTVEYRYMNRWRRAELVRLPKTVFGVRAVMWTSVEIDELHNLAERFRLTLNSIGDGVIAVDADGRITLVNRVAARLTGYRKEELTGQLLEEKLQVLRSGKAAPLREALAGKWPVDTGGPAELVARDGRRYHIADNISPIRDDSGQVTGAVIVFRDVTGELAKQIRLERQNVFLQTAAEVAEMTYFAWSEDGTPPDWEVGGNWGRREDGTVSTTEEWVAPKDLAAFRAAWDEMLAGRRDTLTVVYAAGSENKDRIFEMRAVRKRLEEDGRVEFFGIIRDITAATRAEQQRSNLSLMFQALLTNLPCSVFVKDIADDYRLIMCNEASGKLLGRPVSELIGRTAYDLLPRRQAEEIAAQDCEAAELGTLTERFAEFTDRQGSFHKGKFLRRVVVRADGSKVLLSVCVDVTAEMRWEKEMRETNHLLNLIVNSLPCILWIKDISDMHRYLLINNSYSKLIQTPADDVIGKTDFDLHPVEFARKYVEDDRAVIAAGCPQEYEEYLQGRDRRLSIRTVKIPLQNYKPGRTLLLGMSFDVTELIESRNQLRETNNILQGILDELPAMIMVKDIKNDFRYIQWNRMAERLTGTSAAEALGRNNAEIPAFAEFAEQFRQAEQLAAASGSAESLNTFRGGDGALHMVSTQQLRISAGNSSDWLLLDMSMDVTEEKRLEAERQRLMSELQHYAEQEHLLSSCLEAIMLHEDDDTAIRIVLRAVGEHLNGSRSYIMRYDYERQLAVPFREWNAPGTQPAIAAGRIAPQPFRQTEKWFLKIKRENFWGAGDTASPQAQEELESWGPVVLEWDMRSIYFCAIQLDNEHFWGHVGVVYEDRPYVFSEHDTQLLQVAAHLIEIILARREKRMELERSEYEKLLIMDTIRIPILLFDARMNLIRCNNAALEIAGIPEEQVYRQACWESFCGETARPAACPVQLAHDDQLEHTRELEVKGRLFQLRAYPIMVDGKLLYIMKTMVDITALHETQQQLTRALLEAQSASKAKSYFLATMSHELRTPLNAVIGFSELLQNSSLPPAEQLEYLKSINLAGNSLLCLINDVLDLSKLEAGQTVLESKPTDLMVLLREIQSVFQYKVREKKLTFLLEVEANLPMLYLDHLRLRQILLNLVGNAVKFTDQGGVTVSAAFRKSDAERGRLSIRVRDTGIGIKPEALDKIFQPFGQQDAARDTHVYKGTGLGLTISQRLIVRMGGTIGVESEVGRGSCFTIELPAVKFSGIVQANARPKEHRLISGGQIRILVVDDVPMNLKVLSAMLRKLDVVPLLAGSGEEVLRILSREEKKPDLVLTDMWMPGMNGDALAAAIHALPGCAGLKVVAVTADTEANQNFAVEEFAEILLKPITLKKLTALLAGFRDASGKDEE